jgi:hypothetical protein
MDQQAELTLSHVRVARFRQSGPESLGVRTGRLWQSLRRTDARVVSGGIECAIGSNVKYLRPHEFGGTVPARTIVATNAKALRFMVGGKVVFAKSVKQKARTIPARAPLRRGVQDRAHEMTRAMGQAAIDFLANK